MGLLYVCVILSDICITAFAYRLKTSLLYVLKAEPYLNSRSSTSLRKLKF